MARYNTRFNRLLRLRDFEFYDIILNNGEEGEAYLLFHDTRNPSEEGEEGNHIAIYLVTNVTLTDDSYEDVLSFNNDLLDKKYKCTYFMKTYPMTEKLEFDFPFDMNAIPNYVQKLLYSLDINITLPKISEESFNHLSQE